MRVDIPLHFTVIRKKEQYPLTEKKPEVNLRLCFFSLLVGHSELSELMTKHSVLDFLGGGGFLPLLEGLLLLLTPPAAEDDDVATFMVIFS